MSSVNKQIILGRVGADPEARTVNGVKVVSLSVATSDKYTDKRTGEVKETTVWHRAEVWDKGAEVIERYVKKGDQIYLEGKTEHRSYTDSSGQQKYITEIRVRDFTLLGGGSGAAKPAQQTQRPAAKAASYDMPESDDMPF